MSTGSAAAEITSSIPALDDVTEVAYENYVPKPSSAVRKRVRVEYKMEAAFDNKKDAWRLRLRDAGRN